MMTVQYYKKEIEKLKIRILKHVHRGVKLDREIVLLRKQLKKVQDECLDLRNSIAEERSIRRGDQ